MAGERTGSDSIRGSVRRRLAPGALGVILLLAGAGAACVLSKSGTVALQSELTGTVSVVNATGAKFCVAPSGGGEERCGVAYQRLDAAPLAVGQPVRVAVATIRQSDGTAVEVFIIEP